MNDMIQFDPSALKKRVSETIQTNFGMLIPEEQFSKMVDSAIQEFFTDPSITELREVEYVINPQANSWEQRKGTKLRLGCAIPPFKYMVWCEVHKIAASILDQVMKDKVAEVRARVTSVFDVSSVADIAEKSSEAIVDSVAKAQRAQAVANALEMFKVNLVSVFNQAGAYDVANKIGALPTMLIKE